jgi:predicted MPP superfamily phosphohydrolase
MSTGWLVVLTILAILVAAALIVMVIDNHRFVVREYTVPSSKVRENLTFVFVTDLHSKVYGENNRPLLAAIDDIHPDAVLCGGDLIISKKARQNSPGWMDAALSLLTALTRKYPVYFADGNHESYLLDVEEFHPQYQEFCAAVGEAGVRKLHNETSSIFAHGSDTNVRVTGLDLDRRTYQKILPYALPPHAVEEKIGRADSSKFEILLAHNPKFFETYADWGADLVLSGHVHGGLLRLGKRGFIGPDLHLFPKYSFGEYTLTRNGHKATMILSCGLGSHTLPIRILNPGELTVVRICKDR